MTNNNNPWELHKFGENKEYAIRIRRGTNEYYCDFEICNCPNYDETNYEMGVEGSIKWDGCMNWTTNSNCMYHCCSESDIDTFAMLMKKVWELAKTLMGDKADF